MPDFDPGYVNEPFRTLAGNYPGEDAYPQADFRTEWGPIFHRGRLDGSARLLIIGQDPGQHENVLRRILVGEAGRRVQGLMGKLGIMHSYVMLNALLYSVYGSNGKKYVAKTKVAAYRNQWIEAILASGSLEAVITFGSMAKKAWNEWKKTPAGVASTTPVAHLTHPTQPESAGGTKAERAANTKTLLKGWNAALKALHPHIHHPDVPVPTLTLYGDAFTDADKTDIPSIDLPAGIPPWMYDNDGWARRVGSTIAAKRANITITVPKEALP